MELNAIMPRDELDQVLFEAMAAIYRFEHAKMARFDLDYETIYLLQFLRRRSSARMRDVAQEMDIPVSTATRLIDRLERRQLVARRRDPHDKRIVQVALEPAGERLVQAVEDHTHAMLSRNLQGVSREDVAAFVRTAGQLRGILRVPAGHKSRLQEGEG